jgi:hypothetical protein
LEKDREISFYLKTRAIIYNVGLPGMEKFGEPDITPGLPIRVASEEKVRFSEG